MTWENVKLEILYDLIKNGTTNTVDDVMRKEEIKHRIGNGLKAERLVVSSLNNIDIVLKAKPGNKNDDRRRDDVLVYFVNNIHLPLGVQVKTSKIMAAKYRRENIHYQINRQILMIVNPDDDSKEDIANNFLKRLEELDSFI